MILKIAIPFILLIFLCLSAQAQNTQKEKILQEAAGIFCDCEYTSKFALLILATQYGFLSSEEAAEPMVLLENQGRECVGKMQIKMEEIEGDISEEDQAYLLTAAQQKCPKTLEYTDLANSAGSPPLPKSLLKELDIKGAAKQFCNCGSLKTLQKDDEKLKKLAGLDKIELALSMAATRVQVMKDIGQIRYTLAILPDEKRAEFQEKLEKKINKKCPKLQEIYNKGQ
jgi:hypothetical protein